MVIKKCTVKMVREDLGDYNIDINRIVSPETCEDLLKQLTDIHNSTVEKFGMFSLNTKNAVIGIHILTIGTINSSLVSPRDVIQQALLNNANSIILWHNHPSGDPHPSYEDIKVTKRIKDACQLMDIKLLDHIVIGDNSYSMLAHGDI